MSEQHNITFVELLDETVEYYKTHKRGIKNRGHGYIHTCVYFNGEDMCAVGRCLSDKGRKKYGDMALNAEYLVNKCDISDFQEKYHHLLTSPEAWQELQQFHDLKSNWVETEQGNELSVTGRTAYEELRDQFAFLDRLTERWAFLLSIQ